MAGGLPAVSSVPSRVRRAPRSGSSAAFLGDPVTSRRRLGRSLISLAIAATFGACESDPQRAMSQEPPPSNPSALFRDASAQLPQGALGGLSMDAALGDVDGDGDLDVIVANEFRPNILLINDGEAGFTDGSSRLPRANRDSEDIGLADFDGDGDLDVIVVSEDDRINELYFNDGMGRFTDEGVRLPVTGTSNGVVVADVSGDGVPDILIGNNGRNALLVGDGAGGFVDETTTRLPPLEDVTQDLELGDADGDGDLDVLVGNEGRNRLLINDGTGRFSDESAARLPARSASEETREADFGDVDGDGDLDIFFANVRAFIPNADPQNRLLINDGTGMFTDETETRLPPDADATFDGEFGDVDGDGDLDLLTANASVDLSQGQIVDAPYRVYLNDGTGRFTDGTSDVFGVGIVGIGFDIELGDLDGDGGTDLYLSSRGTADRLLLRR